MEKLFEGVPVEIIVDGLLKYGEDQTDADHKSRRVLEKGRRIEGQPKGSETSSS